MNLFAVSIRLPEIAVQIVEVEWDAVRVGAA